MNDITGAVKVNYMGITFTVDFDYTKPVVSFGDGENAVDADEYLADEHIKAIIEKAVGGNIYIGDNLTRHHVSESDLESMHHLNDVLVNSYCDGDLIIVIADEGKTDVSELLDDRLYESIKNEYMSMFEDFHLD